MFRAQKTKIIHLILLSATIITTDLRKRKDDFPLNGQYKHLAQAYISSLFIHSVYMFYGSYTIYIYIYGSYTYYSTEVKYELTF